jgi:hypothetical protein
VALEVVVALVDQVAPATMVLGAIYLLRALVKVMLGAMHSMVILLILQAEGEEVVRVQLV